MTNTELKKSSMADCGNTAQDCKGNADYAAYAFHHDDEAQAREYVRRLKEDVSRLSSQLAYLDSVNRRIATSGPEGTV